MKRKEKRCALSRKALSSKRFSCSFSSFFYNYKTNARERILAFPSVLSKTSFLISSLSFILRPTLFPNTSSGFSGARHIHDLYHRLWRIRRYNDLFKNHDFIMFAHFNNISMPEQLSLRLELYNRGFKYEVIHSGLCRTVAYFVEGPTAIIYGPKDFKAYLILWKEFNNRNVFLLYAKYYNYILDGQMMNFFCEEIVKRPDLQFTPLLLSIMGIRVGQFFSFFRGLLVGLVRVQKIMESKHSPPLSSSHSSENIKAASTKIDS